MNLSRRHILQAAAATCLARRALAQGPANAQAIILLYMVGGPSHIDTWDPKPGTATGGPFKAIKTRNPALQICEHMPRLADMADKLTVLRGMTSKEGNHQRAQYLMHTSYAPNPTVEHPSLGGWMSKKLGGPASGLPAFVSLGGPSASAGFLGVQYGPFVVQKAGTRPDNIAPAVDPTRHERRLKLLDQMERSFSAETGGGKVDDRRALYTQTQRLMNSRELAAFDIESEPLAVKQSYGDTDFGRACLVARRLVSAGVRFVEVVLDGWDTHQNNFERVQKLLATLDPAMSGLIDDLSRTSLLSRTLVLWTGDFGRTPRINGNEGRDHHPQAWSAVLAGGGTRPGLIGATDASGAKPAGKTHSVADLLATAAQAIGLRPSEEVMSPVGRPIAITDSGVAIRDALA
jgi:hypothetical protein